MKIICKVIRKWLEQKLWGCVFRQLWYLLCRKAVAEIVFSEPLQGTSYHGSDTVKELLPVGSKYLERTLEALWRT